MARASSLLFSSVVVLAACGGGPTVDRRQGELFAESEGMDDEGVKPVGTPSIFYVDLSADIAEVTLQTVSVLAVDSAQAIWTLDGWKGLGFDLPPNIDNADAVTGGKKPVVTTDVKFSYPFVYYSESEAWSQAKITFTHNGRASPTVQDVRLHAGTSEYAFYPTTIDFGWVEVGDVGQAEVTIDNQGDLDFAVRSSPKDNVVTSLEAEVVIVPPHTTYNYKLQFKPITDAVYPSPTQQGTVVFSSADSEDAEKLAIINLRANDCAHGVPDAYDVDRDGFTVCAGDCDDDHDDARPGGFETPDGLDNDCNGLVDDTTPGFDDDDDGYCDHPTSCIDDALLPGDCNDDDPAVNPGVAEINCPDDGNPRCSDGIDNDCNGVTDGGSEDQDGDGYTLAGGDCDDKLSSRAPNKPEVPDNVDNDCDDDIDEGTVLYDDDGDGFCEGISPLPINVIANTCTGPPGGTYHFGDCNDDADHGGLYIVPGASEWVEGAASTWYFGVDNDCDGTIDEGTPWSDDDRDGYTDDAGDCDDDDANVSPGKYEIGGNGIDDDCNPGTPMLGPQ